ncbi:hypothetical protein SGFS_028090 [Streptomyces graminofaciens]|uniref:Aldehyde oxidase/xanthine dehydrogenase second molybdopterin binding domain-containing protein n=1 Tax=Streptomyces graminofaciens TaxID=68212 RepID=A0ABN5VEP6_9ACTN|nr:hypothetical protein SGFS_028090 [Streptomyces graminofaciens]
MTARGPTSLLVIASPPQYVGRRRPPAGGSAVQDGGGKLRKQAITLAVKDEGSPLQGVDPADVVVRGGRLYGKDDPTRGETHQRLLARNNLTHLEALGSYAGAPGSEKFSFCAYAATFAEVAVDATLGLVRVRRMVGVYDAGRIISPRLADSQAIGAMIGGIGQALLEHTVTRARYRRLFVAGHPCCGWPGEGGDWCCRAARLLDIRPSPPGGYGPVL